eukprot:CAMPEP_0114172102 /NCGR_PEP_ID=MMETSP0043_2-20121206/35068_1 /TAXON_ID=464988 /ORGANISM="Hemiselmis andersenii, Strain CCMP644" /LENGTH=41 /DNA_ID= /DNA_START= /DNA_END= /DNA_ORIENTATION=
MSNATGPATAEMLTSGSSPSSPLTESKVAPAFGDAAPAPSA